MQEEIQKAKFNRREEGRAFQREGPMNCATVQPRSSAYMEPSSTGTAASALHPSSSLFQKLLKTILFVSKAMTWVWIASETRSGTL